VGLAVRRLVADGRWHIMGGWYITFYYQECPEWVYKTNFGGGLITPLGRNMLNDQHPGQGTLFQKFDAADCDRRFGLNSLRQAGLNRRVPVPSEKRFLISMTRFLRVVVVVSLWVVRCVSRHGFLTVLRALTSAAPPATHRLSMRSSCSVFPSRTGSISSTWGTFASRFSTMVLW
jgi:hypothetical protein